MTENLNTIDNRKLMKQVGLIAGPIALQSLIASSLNLIDNLMIGGLTPLVGMLVYVVSGVTRIPAPTLFRAILPYLAALLVSLAILSAWALLF